MKVRFISLLLAVITAILPGNPEAFADASVRLNAIVDALLDTSDSATIQFDGKDMVGKYGEYFEASFVLAPEQTAPVRWQALDSLLPPGLDLEDTTANTVHISGYPGFTGTWCFTLAASDESNLGIAAQEVCVSSANNSELRYPRFTSTSRLSAVVAKERFQKKLTYKTNDGLKSEGVVFDAELPEGLTIVPHSESSYFTVQGKFSEPGYVRFTLQVTDAENNVNFQQFQLPILAKAQNPSCAPGYYFDPALGYCVADRATDCPDGTYYDPGRDSCVAYAPPPPSYYCGAYQHYDDFLNACVDNDARRCPRGTWWDSYENRCVYQEHHECGFGQRYDFFTRSCEWIDRGNSCRAGEHYDYNDRRCEPNQASCGPGFVWNGRTCAPARNHNRCGPGQTWDPGRGCIPVSGVCGPGTVFDPRTGRCEGRDHQQPHCGPGQRWDNSQRRCVDFRNPPPRPNPGPHPGPRPGPHPGPHPGPRPGPRPQPPRPAPQPPRPAPQPPRPAPQPPRPAPQPPRPAPQPPRPAPQPPRPAPQPPRPAPQPPRPAPQPPRPAPQPPRPAPQPPRPAPQPPRPAPQPPRPAPQPPRPAPQPPRPAPQPPRPAPQPPRPAPQPPRPAPQPPRPAPQPPRPAPQPPRPSPGPGNPGWGGGHNPGNPGRGGGGPGHR